MPAVTHGPHHSWALSEGKQLTKGPVVVFAEDTGQWYSLQEHEIKAWFAYRGVPFR